MTWEELNEVLDLKKEMKDAEKSLELLRLSATVKVPMLDGMPKAQTTDSRVEILTIRIVDLAKEIEELKLRIIDAMRRLKNRLTIEIKDTTARTLFILKYVDGMLMRDIGFALGYSEAHIYYLHRITLENLIKNNSKS